MAKTNPLSNLKAQVESSLNNLTDDAAPVAAASPPPPAPLSAQEPTPARPTGSKSSREGKRFLGYYVEPLRHDEIKQAAMDEGIQVQELMRRAIDDWMGQHGQEAVRTVAARHARRNKQVI